MRALFPFLFLLLVSLAIVAMAFLDPHVRHHGFAHAAPGIAGVLYAIVGIIRWHDRDVRFTWSRGRPE